MPEITVNCYFPVSENADPYFSLEELHVNGARTSTIATHKAVDYKPNLSRSVFKGSIAKVDFHQQRTSGCRGKLSVSAGPSYWRWQGPPPSSPIPINVDEVREPP